MRPSNKNKPQVIDLLGYRYYRNNIERNSFLCVNHELGYNGRGTRVEVKKDWFFIKGKKPQDTRRGCDDREGHQEGV